MHKNKLEQKNFARWLQLKAKLHTLNRQPYIKEGEVWWCAIGENIGVEVNGKGKNFARPILILRKLSRYSFMGIPLTSRQHNGNWYVSFVFQDTTEIAVLSQARVVSTARLYKYMGVITDTDLQLIRKSFQTLYCLQRPQ